MAFISRGIRGEVSEDPPIPRPALRGLGFLRKSSVRLLRRTMAPENTGTYGWVLFSLLREDDDGGPSTRRVIVSLGERGSDGGVRWRREEDEFENGDGSFYAYICTIRDLREDTIRERVLPGGALTIVCQMKVAGTAATGALYSPDVPIQTDTHTREPNAPTCKCQSLDKKDRS